MVETRGYVFHDEGRDIAITPVNPESAPLDFGSDYPCKVVLSIEERPNARYVFPSKNAVVTWAATNGLTDQLERLLNTIPPDVEPGVEAAPANGARKGMDAAKRLTHVNLDKPDKRQAVSSDLEGKLRELEANLTLEERVQALERAAVRRDQEILLAEVQAVAERLDKPIDSLEVFEAYTGRRSDSTSRTLFLYSDANCTGQVFVVTTFIGNLPMVMEWTPMSARSEGFTSMWDSYYPDPDIPDPVPTTVSQSGRDTWNSLPLVPLAATSV